MKKTASNSLSSTLQTCIAYLKERQIGRLRFPDDLEKGYQVSVTKNQSRRMATAAMALIVIYDLFLLLDLRLIPGRFWIAVWVRLGVFTPIAVLIYFLLKKNSPMAISGAAQMTLAGVASITTLYLYKDGDQVLTASVQIGLLVMLLFTNIVMRLRWTYAALCTLSCGVTAAYFLYINHSMAGADKVNLLCVTLIGELSVLVAAYSLERESRMAYLLQLSNELKTEELAHANEALEILSTRDGLTRLANRGAFDERYAEMWAEAVHGRLPLSAVMIDIDHFKVVNDTQGHLYGDEVIKRVAALIQQGLRGKDDFAARYGGEEFVLLLPDTDSENAVRVAERIRSMIQLAGSPAPMQPVPQPTTGLWTTVSCGVATVESVEGLDRRRLLLAADTALYAAKSEGRNRVCSAIVARGQNESQSTPKDSGWAAE